MSDPERLEVKVHCASCDYVDGFSVPGLDVDAMMIATKELGERMRAHAAVKHPERAALHRAEGPP